MEYRRATASDAEGIAALHTDSWRRHYRGAYSDAFLDGPVVADRLEVWTERLAHANRGACTIVAEMRGAVVGFAHTVFDNDPEYGSLVDNLHVRFEWKGQGVGTQLLSETASAVVHRDPSDGLFLWVLKANTAAQAFYAARGGVRSEEIVVTSNRGGPQPCFRYSWPDPRALLVNETLRSRMEADLTAALRRRDASSVAVLRTTLAAVANAEAVDPSAQTTRVGLLNDVERRVLTEAEVRAIVEREREELQTAIEEMTHLGQVDAAAELQRRASTLDAYLTTAQRPSA